VIPKEWIAASTTPHIEIGRMKAYGDMNRSYGYLWSLYPEQEFYSALGRNGQHIHVFPEEGLVVVFTSATSLVSDEHQFTLLKDYILPSIQSKTALPEKPAAAARLEGLVEAAAQPRRPVAELPSAGQSLNGRPIHIGENSFGWETMTITFKEGEDSADIQFNNGLQLSVGLDNLYRVQELPGSGKVGFKAAWERDDRFTVRQIILGSWYELEISLTIEGDRVTFFQRNVVDGGDLVRIEGKIEE
jgi:hypothetical protein